MFRLLYYSLLLITLSFYFQSCQQTPKNGFYVSDIEEFNQAVINLEPGSKITLANGIWKDAELLLDAKGTKDAPIIMEAETRGKVILQGNSNLRISGEHLIVKGLVFKNGFTATNEVISFKKDNQNLANNCRLTECVIDNFSNPERHEQDTWVAIYGKNNRIDHNHLAGKRNLGVTMTVRLNTEESRENFHRIDHNYFGPRPNLGANGGETLRIGTSHYSLTNSNTLVESNFFDRCSGEHEIISNKSCQNTFRHNVFYECSGTLTMRHGNETLVDGNVFIGNDKPSTGGIRVINEKQTVINNYGIGLKGYRFRGALVVMNGVPNSPINRYFQVDSAVIKNNTFVNCDHIQLCAGSDKERSATPINSVMENNVFYNEKKNDIFTVYDDISGIEFKGNLLGENINNPFSEGFVNVSLQLKKDSLGYLMPVDDELDVYTIVSTNIAKKDSYGVAWYSKKDEMVSLGSGKTIVVSGGMNTIYDAVKSSSPGDIISLTDDKDYLLTKVINIQHPLSFVSASGKKVRILFEKNSLFDIQNGGSLSLEGLILDGSKAPDYSGNSVIRTSKYSMNQNYKLFIENCVFQNLDMNHSSDVFRVFKNTFADTISIQHSEFRKITGNVMALDKENDDKGIYNAEYVILKNNVFSDIEGMVLRLYRGGTDESTFGPFLELDHCVFNNVGNGPRNKFECGIDLYGVQVTEVSNNIFNECKPIKMHLVVGEPIVSIMNNDLYKSGSLEISGDQKYEVKNLWNLDPKFKDILDFTLKNDSPLRNKGIDGTNLGVVKWKE